MGKSSIKMYDKFSKILRIETTTNDVTFFKHYREVEHRNGTKSMKYASLKKNIYSLSLLSHLLKASNRRYLEFISAFDNKEVGRKRLEKVSQSKKVNNRNYKGFNLFSKEDIDLLLIILRGEYNISGLETKISEWITTVYTGKFHEYWKVEVSDYKKVEHLQLLFDKGWGKELVLLWKTKGTLLVLF